MLVSHTAGVGREECGWSNGWAGREVCCSVKQLR